MTPGRLKSYTELQSRGRAVAARRAHNPEVVGSNPTPATKVSERHRQCAVSFLFHMTVVRLVMRAILYSLLITSLLAVPITGCSSNQGTKAEPPYAGPIAEAALTSISDGDYEKHIEIFLPELHSNLPETAFNEAHSRITGEIGRYQDKEFVSVTYQSPYTVVIYQARFSEEPASVTVRVVFQEAEGEMKVTGFWLDSPRLRNIQ